MTAASELSFEEASKSFSSGASEITALDRVSLKLVPERITGLVGPDGAGKTTLLRVAAGLMLPDAGAVRSIGLSVAEDSLSVQSQVGYMPQRFGLYEDLTVKENLDLHADLRGVSGEERSRRYAELMHMTALAPFVDRLAGRLSGGMKQKLGLACALLKTPRLLLLDEPTAGVDPVSRRELWQIVNRLVREEGSTVLVSTAYLDEAERCDDVILLHQGRVLGQDTPDRFRARVRGRAWLAASSSLGRRALQSRLAGAPGVVDAVLDNDRVRVVTADAGETSLDGVRGVAADIEIVAAEPTFEDAFIAALERPPSHATPTLGIRRGPAERGGVVIEVEGVQKWFGTFQAVRDVSFKVRRGEVFGLLGANGAGKSTTFRMLCGLLPASAGRLTVAGNDLRRSAASARRQLGYMAQRFSLYASLTVLENLRFFAGAYGLRRKLRRQRIDWALDTFELAPFSDKASGTLPLGFRQRLAMAAALMHEPQILFLDEPTSGVDPLARREFWQRINTLADAGVTVLVTTHFMDEANYCDRLVIMADGAVLAEGSPDALKARFSRPGLESPTMEDAFIALIEGREGARSVA